MKDRFAKKTGYDIVFAGIGDKVILYYTSVQSIDYFTEQKKKKMYL